MSMWNEDRVFTLKEQVFRNGLLDFELQIKAGLAELFFKVSMYVFLVLPQSILSFVFFHPHNLTKVLDGSSLIWKHLKINVTGLGQ